MVGIVISSKDLCYRQIFTVGGLASMSIITSCVQQAAGLHDYPLPTFLPPLQILLTLKDWTGHLPGCPPSAPPPPPPPPPHPSSPLSFFSLLSLGPYLAAHVQVIQPSEACQLHLLPIKVTPFSSSSKNFSTTLLQLRADAHECGWMACFRPASHLSRALALIVLASVYFVGPCTNCSA